MSYPKLCTTLMNLKQTINESEVPPQYTLNPFDQNTTIYIISI